MAGFNYNDEVTKLLQSDDNIVEVAEFVNKDGEPLLVRQQNGPNDPLEVGDKFVVPKDAKPYKVTFKNGGEGICIIVEVTGINGAKRLFRFFPNSLLKVVASTDKEGLPLGRVACTGSAGELFSQANTIQEGLALLAEKTIVVSEMTGVFRLDFTSKEVKATRIYKYDLVD